MELAASIVVAVLCCSSAACWAWLAVRWRNGALTFDARPRERRPVELIPVVLAALWIGQSLAARVADEWSEIGGVTTSNAAPDADDTTAAAEEFDPEQVLQQLRIQSLFQTLLLAVLLLALTRGVEHPLSAFGIAFNPFGCQLGRGAFAATLSWLPVFAVVLLTQELRTVERQHSVLRMLDEAPGLETWFWAVLMAAMIAPLVEELLFRVVVQGWLTPRLGAPAGIGITALLFSAVHGFPDSLALIPLALILGCTYHWRLSYVTIVAAHAFFNGTMLVLQTLLQPM